MSKIVDALKAVVLMLAALCGIVVSVLDFVGQPPSWAQDVPSLTLFLLGLLTLDLCLERFTAFRRIEDRLESMEWAKEVHDLTGEQRDLINKCINDFVTLQNLMQSSQKANPPFSLLVDEIIEEQVLLLSKLAVGRLTVPADQTAPAHSKMAVHYRERLDAVSETDLDFWTDKQTLAEEYFMLNVRAVRNGTAVTRIFIISLFDLKSRPHEIAAVLERQHRAGIGWGVAVLEELEYDVRHADVPLDFVLFDGDKAVSFFRKKEARRFEAIYLTYGGHGNVVRIGEQRKIHQKLITECWLANDIFKESYPGALTDSELKEVRRKTATYNVRLNKKLGISVVEDDTFVLLASSSEQIDAKVQQLAEIVDSWRIAQGYH